MSHEIPTPDTPEQPEEPQVVTEPEMLIDQPTEGFAFMATVINEQLDNIELTMATFADSPMMENGKTMEKVLNVHYESVNAAVNAICEENDSNTDAALRAGMDYIAGLEVRRVKFLNELELGETFFEPVDYKKIDAMCEGLAANNVLFDPANIAFGYYMENLKTDVEKLVDAASDQYESKPSTRRKEILTSLGYHALDVAKYGVAVFGAIALAKRSKIL